MRFGCRPVSWKFWLVYLCFTLLMASQRFIKSDVWQHVILVVAVGTLVGAVVVLCVDRRRWSR